MNVERSVLAIDIGSSGVKACFISENGDVLAKAIQTYEPDVTLNRVEQAPSVWWSAVVSSVNSLTRQTATQPEAIILTGQMQASIFLKDGEALLPAILYSDTRAQNEIEMIQRMVGEQNLIQITGNLNDSSSVIAKLLWVKHNAPSLYQHAEHLLLAAHDYIHWKLCASVVTDYTNACTTGLLNIQENDWAVDLLQRLDLRTDWLPELMPAGQKTGDLSREAAGQMGLKAGIPVFHGAGDAASATIGSGAGEPGHFYIYLGTSGWLGTTGYNIPVDPLTGIWNLRHVDPMRMIYLGPMLTTAGNWEWVSETFGVLEADGQIPGKSKFDRIEAVAAKSPAGSNGVFFLPMISGERAPVRDPNASGVFLGIRRTTTRADLYRAVLEGVAYAMRTIRDVMQAMMPANAQFRELYLTGGGARSALWAQIFADVMSCTVKVLASPEDVGVKGMAIVVGKTLGWHDHYIPEGSFIKWDTVYQPSIDESHYGREYPIYSQIYPSLKPLFEYSARLRAEIDTR